MKTFTEDQIKQAIEGSGAIIETIARRLKVAWETARKLTEPYKELLENEQERTLDYAEQTIIKAITKDVKIAKWYLMTKGKDRGYLPPSFLPEQKADTSLMEALLEAVKGNNPEAQE